MPTTSRSSPPTGARTAALALAVGTALATTNPAIALAQPAASAGTGDPWRIIPLAQASIVLARDGSTVVGEIGRQIRTSVAVRSLPRFLPAAFVAVEDKRFYQHNGVDVVGIAGALKDAVLGEARGASTITQQLVGNMHPDAIDRRDRSPGRKLREQEAAIQMSQHYSKEQVLEAYLNTIYFNHGRYGVDAAARYYFGKPAAALSLSEAASLAAMPKSPVLYDPARFPARNQERRNTVLDLMADQGMITRAQADAAKLEPVRTVAEGGVAAASRYFVDVVRTQAERAGVPIAQGGYRVVTTLDPALQVAAADALAQQTAAIERRPGWRRPTRAQYEQARTAAAAALPNASAPNATASNSSAAPAYLQGAVVALDPTSGEVRALVGGRDYTDSPYDRAINGRRQPGSSFKPFVYSTALAEGMPPNALVGDTAMRVPLPDGRVYTPENADGEFLGLITMREALARSRNPVAVQLWLQAGPDSVVALAHRAGINTPIAPNPANALGATALQPLDFIAAYAAFDNGGLAVSPRFVARVEDRAGRAIWAPAAAAPTPAIDPRVSFIMRDLMRDVVERGTATSVRRFVPARVPVAGKTGTTSDNVDVWFVGMTPDLVAGVWLGFDRPQPITSGAAGGTLAAPVWGQMVARWYQNRAPGSTWGSPPPGVVSLVLDRQTGQAADTTTPDARKYTEYFLEGTEPGAQAFDPWTVFRTGPVIRP
ncbi:MAG TPA: PBP1A family penicillin-binding protein [Gemmatirosa sp.]